MKTVYNNFMIAPDEGGGGSYNPPYNPPANPPTEDIATIIDNLKVGEVRKPWLGKYSEQLG